VSDFERTKYFLRSRRDYSNAGKMKPEQLYQELKDLAEKLEINVSEQNLRKTGIKVKSGLCKVKGKNIFIMDKHKSLHKKIKILASQLSKQSHEDLYVVPAVREMLDKYASQSIRLK
jgi:ABC-type enterochelin transport system substrate-binding protein